MKGKGGKIKSMKIDEKDQQMLDLTPEQKANLPNIWKERTKLNEQTVLSFFICMLWGLRIHEAAALCKDNFSFEKGKDDNFVKIAIVSGKGNKMGYAFSASSLAKDIFNFIKTSVNLPYYIFFTESEQISIALDAKRLTTFKSKCAIRASNLSTRIKRFTASKFGSENGVSAHALRRYYANNLYEKGMKAETLAVFMRHQSSKTSISYVGTKKLLKSTFKDLDEQKDEEESKSEDEEENICTINPNKRRK